MNENAPSVALSKETYLVAQTAQGQHVRAVTTRVTRHSVTFDFYSPGPILFKSEVLGQLQLSAGDRLIYSGRGIVANLIEGGGVSACEVTLEDGWIDVDPFGTADGPRNLNEAFRDFFHLSQRTFKVAPEFKVAVGDLHMFLRDIRSWLDQIELGIRSQPGGSRTQLESDLLASLQQSVLPTLGELFMHFDIGASRIEPELQAIHALYAKRFLHPLVLCAPFMYRTFQKPLGYAGDYEMVNMMLRNPFEGGSLFAKLLNRFFLSTGPVVAHRNRIEYLVEMLKAEVSRLALQRRNTKILSMGCGPAQEVQKFVESSPVCNKAELLLYDFNDETLQHVERVLQEILRQHHRKMAFKVCKKSVTQLLKEGAKRSLTNAPGGYDVVYCTGLFDYLPNHLCAMLVKSFYDLLKPGGLLLVSNVDPSNQSRGWMELVVDWHLFYRDSLHMARLAPADAPNGAARVFSEMTGVNVFLEVRKPENA